MLQTPSTDAYMEHMVDIISAYVSNNSVPVGELVALINDVHSALSRLNSSEPAPVVIEAPKPAISPKKSICSG